MRVVKVRLIPMNNPGRYHRYRWDDLIRTMKHRDSIVLKTESLCIAFGASARKKGYTVIRRKCDGGFRVWLKKGIERSQENWNVDIENLPIPESAFSKGR